MIKLAGKETSRQLCYQGTSLKSHQLTPVPMVHSFGVDKGIETFEEENNRGADKRNVVSVLITLRN